MNQAYFLFDTCILVIQEEIQQIIQESTFISASMDEVTANDNTQYMGVHVYCVKPDSIRQALFLKLRKITELSANANTLTAALIEVLAEAGGLSEDTFAASS